LKDSYEKAGRLMQKGNLDEAIALFRNVVEKNKNYPDAAAKLAECLKIRGVRSYTNRNYDPAIKGTLRRRCPGRPKTQT